MWYVMLPPRPCMVWNIRHCKLKQKLCGHTGAVFAVDCDEKTKLAYAGSENKVNTIRPLTMEYSPSILLTH